MIFEEYRETDFSALVRGEEERVRRGGRGECVDCFEFDGGWGGDGWCDLDVKRNGAWCNTREVVDLLAEFEGEEGEGVEC